MFLMIDLYACRSINAEYEQEIQVLTVCMSELDSIIHELKLIEDTAIQLLVLKLKNKKVEIYENIRKIQLMLKALNQILYQYENAEKRIEDFSEAYFISNSSKIISCWPSDSVLVKKLRLPKSIVSKYFN